MKYVSAAAVGAALGVVVDPILVSAVGLVAAVVIGLRGLA